MLAMERYEIIFVVTSVQTALTFSNLALRTRDPSRRSLIAARAQKIYERVLPLMNGLPARDLSIETIRQKLAQLK
jgi:hypothetical protein